MIVASGSTPLITLVKAAQLDILHEPFDEVVISDAAFRELTTTRRTRTSPRRQTKYDLSCVCPAPP